MKNKHIARMAITLGLMVILILSSNIAAIASTETNLPSVTRTNAWDAIEYTLGGIPESVKKIEYAGSVFYLGNDVTEDNFLTVLATGADAVGLKPPQDNGKLYEHPVYILWDSDKTALLVHPIIFDYDKVLEAVATPAEPPASLTGKTAAQKPVDEMTDTELTEYLLSPEYADAVRTEFYRLLNEYRAANGLRELEVNLELQGYADIRAAEQRTRFGHTRPNGTAAGSGWHNSKNIVNSRYSENAAGVGTLSRDPNKTAKSVFTRWQNSAGHNRHMLYNFNSRITMALGIAPMLDENGTVTSGLIFATGY